MILKTSYFATRDILGRHAQCFLPTYHSWAFQNLLAQVPVSHVLISTGLMPALLINGQAWKN